MERILGKVFISNGDLTYEYTCVWDTGAMETLISDKIISDLNPEKEGGYVYLVMKNQKDILLGCV